MKKHKRKLFTELEKDLALIRTLRTYHAISREILNKLNELENLFKELKSVPDNPTSYTDNASDLHLKIAIRTYELARSLRQDTEFIQSQDPNETNLIYITLRSMSAAQLTQTDKIPETDEALLTCANILNKSAYYCLTNDSQKMAEILLKKAGYIISNIKNTKSEKYRVTTAKTTAAMDFLCPKKITSDIILANLKDKQLRILAKLYSDYAVNNINLIYKFHDAFSCVNMLEKITNPTEEDNITIINTKTFIVKTLIAQINNDIYKSIKYCRSLAETMPDKLIWSLNTAENVFTQTKNSKYKLIIIQLIKSYCFMKLNDSTNARQSLAFVQENKGVIKQRFPLTKHFDFYNIYLSIIVEIKSFLDSVGNPIHLSVTQPEKVNPASIPSKKKKRKRNKKKKNNSNPVDSNPNRFFQPLPESHTVEENPKDFSATQTENKNPSIPVTANSFFNPSYESYSDEDIIKLLRNNIKTKRVRIESVIPFNELTDKLTKELLTVKDRKCSTLIPINCEHYHAFLYMKQNSENPEFFYFDLQESVPKNIYDKIAELFPNSEIENVTTSNLEATKKIIKKYNSFLKTIKNPKKYDSLLIFFIECYINPRCELFFQQHKANLSALANLEYNANQDYLSQTSHNTPSMNNTP